MKKLLARFALSVGLAIPASLPAQTLSNYQYVVSGQSPTAYFKLDGTLTNAVNDEVVLESFSGGYAFDVYRNTSNCWFFVEQFNTAYLQYLTDSLINGGGTSNVNANAKGSITFLFRMLSGPNIGGQRFLFDATTTAGMGTSNHNALSLFLENDTSTNNPNSLKLRFGDVTTTIMQATNRIASGWYYFALTYDEARVPNKAIWYLGPAGGVLSTGMTTNSADAVAGEGTGLIIGQRAGYSAAFRSPGRGRIDEFAIWARELSSTEISNQFVTLPQPPPPGGSYQQVVAAQIPKYHFKLDNSLIESVGNTLMLSTNGNGGAFTSDFSGNPNSAYSFSETNDALFVTNDLINGGGPTTDTAASGIGTISFLFRMLSDTNNLGQRFVFSAPGVEATGTEDNALGLFLENNPTNNPNSLKLRVGNTTKGNVGVTDPVPVAYATNLVPNAWYYFAMTYDESRNTPEVYVYFGQAGGTLVSSSFNPANASVVGDNGPLVLGNKIEFGGITNNAFRNPGEGAIDEFAIWHEELSTAEIAAQFNALVSGPAPTLSIVVSEGNAILSWPNTTPASYVLEATPALVGQTWTNAGSPATVGTNFVVTNALSGEASFFRLRKP